MSRLPNSYVMNSYATDPANTGNLPNAVSMLGQRRKRCANIETALGECPCLLEMVLDKNT